ncbi:MAG TPA: glucuronate isomerase [Bacteroidota bacterium]|nr:glucuronate isomerase [Bacteroidota bacterium]
MSATFIHEDFLLGNKYARELYHTYASPLPVIDYHCHLSASDIALDRRFETITQIWLAGDHYKWRAMRTCGIEERFITGDATDWEKFEKWAETVPKTLRSPLYHWTHLELRRPFGISDRLLSPSTAKEIWKECNAKLATGAFSVRGILRQMNVEVICTVNDPIESLEHHVAVVANPAVKFKLLPTFRPDRALAVEHSRSFLSFCRELAGVAGRDIRTYADFIEALDTRHEYFHAKGCRLSDHGIESLYAADYTSGEVEDSFHRLLSGETLESGSVQCLKSSILHDLSRMDWERGWVQQFHIGALRNTNSRMLLSIGLDAGCDSIADGEIARPLARFLDRLDKSNMLAKTVLYNLNPRDNELFAAMAGNFQDGSCAGKIQYGPAWWFLDQLDGMSKQIEALSDIGVLSQFIGMTTDSRSFLSYTRHEYFRRLLCRILGNDMTRGLVPDDLELVGKMVQDISYFNAKRYFNFQG